MPAEDIDTMMYILDDQGDEQVLQKPFKYMLRIIKYLQRHRIATGNPIGDDWLSVTIEEYDTY